MVYKNGTGADTAVWRHPGGPEGPVRPGRGTPRPRMILPMLRWLLQLHRSSQNELRGDNAASVPGPLSHPPLAPTVGFRSW